MLGQPGIRIGLPKKGLFKETWQFLRNYMILDLPSEAGILKDSDRRLSFPFGDSGQVMLDRQRDLVVDLKSGVIDIGIIGEDEFWEAQAGGISLFQIDKPLGFGQCRMCLEVRVGSSQKYSDVLAGLLSGKLVTGYPNLARCLHPI